VNEELRALILEIVARLRPTCVVQCGFLGFAAPEVNDLGMVVVTGGGNFVTVRAYAPGRQAGDEGELESISEETLWTRLTPLCKRPSNDAIEAAIARAAYNAEMLRGTKLPSIMLEVEANEG